MHDTFAGPHFIGQMHCNQSEDKIEIMELASRYALAMDEHDAWCVDGKWEGPLGGYVGRAQLPNLLRDLGERNEGRRHVITNHVIDILSATEAEQTCYMQIFAYRGGCRAVSTAVYRDRLQKVDVRWHFVHRILRLES